MAADNADGKPHFEQLALDLRFKPRLLVDADSFGHFEQGNLEFADAVSTTNLGLEQRAKDWEVARAAYKEDRFVFTSDRAFHYDAYKGSGQVPPGIVYVPQDTTLTPEGLQETTGSLSWDGLQPTGIPVLNYLNPEKPYYAVLQVPPPCVWKLLHKLDGHGQVTSQDLAQAWNCSCPAACRRARSLINRAWLGVVKEGRQNMYFAGRKLVEFRKKAPRQT